MRNIFISVVCVVVVLAGVSAQPAVKTKAQADKWRTYAKIQIENATNEMPVTVAYRDNLIADLAKLNTEFNMRKDKMDAADVTKCTNQLAYGNGKVTLCTNTLAKAQKELDKASMLFSASSNAYTLGLWGVAANKATESDIEGGNSNRHIERAGELLDVGYEHWGVVDKVLAKYRMGMENDG
jgi:hypothetical protein